jgi:hypothetical protein
LSLVSNLNNSKFLRPGFFGIFYSSINIGEERKFHSESEEEVPQVISNHNILECKSIPHLLWTSKRVTLHNEIGVAVVEGICCSINSKLVI